MNYFLQDALGWFGEHYLQKIFLNPWFYLLVALILTLERLIPADPEQKTLSKSFKSDLIWFAIEAIQLAGVTVYIVFLEVLYHKHFEWLTIQPIARLPYWFHFVWGFLLSDFLGWFHHWIRHKIPVFWDFHKLHHSQRNLNLFTDHRYHFVEYFIARTITTWPMLMFAVGSPSIIAFNLFHQWYTKFYHANIRTNLGPLRYILVTPQSHRIHHSVEHRHFDKNFGVMLSIWDRLFGTLYEPSDEYPKTGLPDEEFCLVAEMSHANPLRMIVRQFWQPFKLVWRRLRG